MQVKTGDRIYLEAPAQAEPADSVVTADFYTQLPQIRMTGISTGHRMEPETTVEVMLDGNDVAKLVECAIRHPAVNMRYAVLAAIWNHPDSFQRIFQFGLEAPLAFSEIREIVAQELGKTSAPSRSQASDVVKPAGKTLLPRMPLPPASARSREVLGVYGGMNENFVLVAGRSRWESDGV